MPNQYRAGDIYISNSGVVSLLILETEVSVLGGKVMGVKAMVLEDGNQYRLSYRMLDKRYHLHK